MSTNTLKTTILMLEVNFFIVGVSCFNSFAAGSDGGRLFALESSVSKVVQEGDSSGRKHPLKTQDSQVPYTATFSGTPTTGFAPLFVDFYGSSTIPAECLPDYFYWDFGDGHTQSAYYGSVTHVYTQPGIYTVYFNNCGAWCGGCVSVTNENYIEVWGAATTTPTTTSTTTTSSADDDSDDDATDDDVDDDTTDDDADDDADDDFTDDDADDDVDDDFTDDDADDDAEDVPYGTADDDSEGDDGPSSNTGVCGC